MAVSVAAQKVISGEPPGPKMAPEGASFSSWLQSAIARAEALEAVAGLQRAGRRRQGLRNPMMRA